MAARISLTLLWGVPCGAGARAGSYLRTRIAETRCLDDYGGDVTHSQPSAYRESP